MWDPVQKVPRCLETLATEAPDQVGGSAVRVAGVFRHGHDAVFFRHYLWRFVWLGWGCGRGTDAGGLAVVLGVLVAASAMAVFMVVQVGLLNFLGGSKRLDEVLVTGAVLVAALSFVWAPAFGVFYWRQGKMRVKSG